MAERRLKSEKDVQEFFEDVLGLPGAGASNDQRAEFKSIARSIAQIETVIEDRYNCGTLKSDKHRAAEYSDPPSRIKLRERVVDELWLLSRTDDDTDICLGQGGARPQADVRRDHTAYIIVGSPAAGKSYLARLLSDQQGAYLLDPDYAKQKLPEFGSGEQAAVVHKESSMLVGAPKGDTLLGVSSLLDRCADEHMNIVLPKVGDDIVKIDRLHRRLASMGYKCYLCLASVDRLEATKRALIRFIETGRYVPLSFCYDVVANEPELTYHRLRHRWRNPYEDFSLSRRFEGTAAYWLGGEKGSAPPILCSSPKWPGIEFEQPQPT
jgi:hypothetical protein